MVNYLRPVTDNLPSPQVSQASSNSSQARKTNILKKSIPALAKPGLVIHYLVGEKTQAIFFFFGGGGVFPDRVWIIQKNNNISEEWVSIHNLSMAKSGTFYPNLYYQSQV